MNDPQKKPLEQERREYRREILQKDALPEDPMVLFELWIAEARTTAIPDPTAMTLATVGPEGKPSSRVVLLKAIEEGRLIFFTNYRSRKGQELENRPWVAAHFYWPELERQVRIEGEAERIAERDSEDYFLTRPFDSQISAWASPQSEEIPDRDYLEARFEKYAQKFRSGERVPRPGYWGGYRITPARMEFWQGGVHRLHDRIEYTKISNGWNRVRLAP